MNILQKINNFLNPEVEAKKFLELIKQQNRELKQQRQQIKKLFKEIKEEEKWRHQYTGALSLLTESMQSSVWQKDIDHKYILANPNHCLSFFGFEGTKECLRSIIGRSDKFLIDNMFIKHGLTNTFTDICLITDKYVCKEKKITHFFENGIIDDVEILMYVVKIPQFENGKLIGTMGIGWDFTKTKDIMYSIFERWKKNNEIKILFENNDTFCYIVEPEIKRCEMFHHICPLPCNERRKERREDEKCERII